MCGICGEIVLNGGVRPEQAVVAAMAGTLAHRGPDDQGLHVDERVALANRRLSIIDLVGGHQPVYNEDRSVCVVFNGEVYNQGALRSQLQRVGHQFSSRTDTEVLVHLHEEHGDSACEQLNGMFAYALWDQREGRALLVRDRLGIKPLYYFHTPERLVFGSEIKAVLAHPAVPREMDPEALDVFLALRFLPEERTLFKGIRKLVPGSMLLADTRDGTVVEKRYWDPAQIAGGGHEAQDTEDLREEIRSLLEQSVHARLMSDVPFGAFLSGGLDSSGVVALMSRELGSGVRTFSIGFSEEERLDETNFARSVAQRWGTEHHEVDCTAAAVETLPRLIHHFDEPFADPIIVPTYQVAELAARHVKVVLTGEGADEVFGGYSRFVSDQYIRRLRGMPSGLRWLAGRLAAAWPGTAGTQIRRAVSMGAMEPGRRFLQWVLAYETGERRDLYTRDMGLLAGEGAAQMYLACQQRVRHLDETSQMLFCDLVLRLPECMLARTDRMTMAVSLEGRTPFLDHRLVERMLQLPGQFKVRGRREKVLLKQALADVLPPAVVQRRKQGLAVPFAQWTRYGIETHIRRILRPERMRSRGWFVPGQVQELIGRWGPHAARHSQRLWSLLCVELWARMYLDEDVAPDTPLSEVD